MASKPKRTTKKTTKKDTAAASKPAVAPKPKKTSKTAASKPLELDEQAVRERAYHIYQARNGGPGDAYADWQQAERELRNETSL